MSYPQETVALKNLGDGWFPPDDIAAEYGEAIAIVNRAARCVAIFDLLKGRDDLDQDGIKLVLGCAHMINLGQWYQKTEEALLFVANNIGRLEPEPPPGPLP